MSKTVLCDNLKAGLDRFSPFPPETLASLHNYYRVGLTWSSNALEGNSLTESEAKVIIEDGLTVYGKPLHDVYEALGHADAYDYIHSMAVDKDLEINDILKLHELFYKRINPEQSGKFRSVKVFISGSRYPLPAPEKIAALMDEFIAWLNKNENKLHPVTLAAEVHKRFVFIHADLTASAGRMFFFILAKLRTRNDRIGILFTGSAINLLFALAIGTGNRTIGTAGDAGNDHQCHDHDGSNRQCDFL